MPISNDEELKAAVAQAGDLLQEIHNYCAQNNRPRSEMHEAKVRFPRGFIRTADMQRGRISFIRDPNLKSNLAYTLILSDAVLWLSLRTDIWGIPQEMLTKLYAFLLGSLCESLTKNYLHGVCGKGFKGRTEYLKDAGIIDDWLQEDLDWLWEARNRMHFFQLPGREYHNDYDTAFHVRAVDAFRGLIEALSEHDRLESNK
ncbi:hypothetical protein [Marinobacter maritimus]|jgi:hypothetical protein|uniref:hypothetical protein n=1 Tax=Marinobacter maritimus TaxID=277961 RepID=UPI0016426F4B|nr:hypothetical protein [Marinobacter maritimus]